MIKDTMVITMTIFVARERKREKYAVATREKGMIVEKYRRNTPTFGVGKIVAKKISIVFCRQIELCRIQLVQKFRP